MSEHTYLNAVHHAGTALPHLDWFEMVAVRGHLADGEVAHYQVTIKVGYRLGADGR